MTSTPSPRPEGDTTDETTLHVRRVVDGDAGSLDWVVRHFTPLLRAQARYRLSRHLQGTHDVEDLVQRTWLIGVQRLGSLVPREGRLTPVLVKYLSSTLLQTYRNLLREAASRPAAAAGQGGGHDDDSDPACRVPADSSGVITRAVRQETVDAVNRAIAELPDADRELLVLRGIEQMPYALLAVKLEAPEGALRVRYHRTLKRLRSVLPAELAEALESGD